MDDTAKFRRVKRGVLSIDNDGPAREQPPEKTAKRGEEPITASPPSDFDEVLETPRRKEESRHREKQAAREAELRAERAESQQGVRPGSSVASGGAALQPQQVPLPALPAAAVIDRSSLAMECDPINIFQLCHPDAADSMPIDDACEQLSTAFEDCGRQRWLRFCHGSLKGFTGDVVDRAIAALRQGDPRRDASYGIRTTVYCAMCGWREPFKDFFRHMLDIGHKFHVKRRGAAISRPAVEFWLQVLHVPQSRAAKEAARNNSPHNILKMCQPDEPESISFDDAVGQIRPKWEACGEDKLMRRWSENPRRVTNFNCDVCGYKKLGLHLISHFLSRDHSCKMRENGCAVSLPALQHWLHELQLAADADSSVEEGVPEVTEESSCKSIKISEVHENGRYIYVKNESATDVQMKNFVLKSTNGVDQISYKFNKRILEADSSFAVFSSGWRYHGCGMLAKPFRWPKGRGATVVLYDAEKKEVDRYPARADTVAHQEEKEQNEGVEEDGKEEEKKEGDYGSDGSSGSDDAPRRAASGSDSPDSE